MTQSNEAANLPAVQTCSETSLILSAKLKARIGEPLTPSFMAAQMERLQTVFGVPHGRSEYQLAGMMREWFHALSAYGQFTVQRAVTEVIANHATGFWPALGLLVAWCRNEDNGWRDALGLKAEANTREAARDRASENYQRWRARDDALHGLAPGGEAEVPSEAEAVTERMSGPPKVEPKPASQDMGPPSRELLAARERWRINALRDAEFRAELARGDDGLEER